MTFRHTSVQHILLFPATPWIDSAPYEAALSRLQADTDLWWNSKGVDLGHPAPMIVRGHNINVYQENPWPQTLAWLNEQPFYAPFLAPRDLYVVYLYGWSRGTVGWGGRPLAVVGDYALNALASVGSPDSIWDDQFAGNLVMHEEGHSMGLDHDFQTPGAVMGYGWKGYNSIIGEVSDAELRSQPMVGAGPVTPIPCAMRLDYDIERPSPYYGGYRSSTAGIILHSTRGNAASVEQEFNGTLSWFQSNPYEISAHAVIAFDGRIARCVEEGRIAHHAGIHNGRWLGIEVVQPRPGDPISDAQYQTLARWCQSMGERFGFTPNSLTLQEHKDMPQGIGSGKSDIGPPFSVAVLLDYINNPPEEPMPELTPAIKDEYADLFNAWWEAGGWMNFGTYIAATGAADVPDYQFREFLRNRLDSVVNEVKVHLDR